jgi:MFS family permease
MRWGLGRDASLLIGGQGLRAAGYGFTAVVLGALLAARGYGPVQAGVVLTALIAGTALSSLAVGAVADRLGRRRCYAIFFLAVAAAGAAVAAGGGLVTTGFLSYYLSQRYHVSISALGWLFFAVSVVQALSVLIAPRLARRFGLVATMVGTHLPSNVLLASVAFAPTFPVAATLLLARTTLSQMDVPTRQALVMTVVTPDERTAAAAVTNAARYTVRPLGPLVAGAVQQIALGAPLVLAGAIKGGYDIALWRWARHLPLQRPVADPPPQSPVSAPSVARKESS